MKYHLPTKVLAVMLALSLVVCSVPMPSFAVQTETDEEAWEEQTSDSYGYSGYLTEDSVLGVVS